MQTIAVRHNQLRLASLTRICRYDQYVRFAGLELLYYNHRFTLDPGPCRCSSAFRRKAFVRIPVLQSLCVMRFDRCPARVLR